MKNKKDFELDLLLAVDELLYEVNVRFWWNTYFT